MKKGLFLEVESQLGNKSLYGVESTFIIFDYY